MTRKSRFQRWWMRMQMLRVYNRQMKSVQKLRPDTEFVYTPYTNFKL